MKKHSLLSKSYHGKLSENLNTLEPTTNTSAFLGTSEAKNTMEVKEAKESREMKEGRENSSKT